MRILRAIGSLGLCVAGLGTALVLCEATVRVLDGQPITALRLSAPPPALPLPQRLDPTIGGGPLPADVDPEWLEMSPPAPPRTTDDPDIRKLQEAAVSIDVRRFELFRVWNRYLVEQTPCVPGSLFQKLPQPLLVFDPAVPTLHPPFRYLPSRTLPGGLVTNRFGWRGPDIPVDKAPQTVRIAFVGASTTVGLYTLPFSYPDYVIHWLNLWAVRAGLPVRFDGINAGREGIWVDDIAAIVQQEVLPFEPDLVVFYEGANQSLCVRAHGAAPPPTPPGRTWKVVDGFVQAFRDRSALARRLETALFRLQARGGYEPIKPYVKLSWPKGLDETQPDLASPRLPPHLQNLLGGLDTMRTDIEATGGELAVSSFEFLVFDGLRLDPLRDGVIYRHLNAQCWPLRYADLRRDIDLHNHVLEQYAAARDLPFIDVAGVFPPDPTLFFDAIHFNADGTRAHAWIVFRALLPLVRARIESGAWPQRDRVPQPADPIGSARPLTVSCR
jgi:hypothetical protein